MDKLKFAGETALGNITIASFLHNVTNLLVSEHMFLKVSLWILAFAFSASLCDASPTILNHSETAFAGDIIYLQGGGFGNVPVVQFSYNDSNWRNLTPLETADGAIMLKIPVAEQRLPDLITIRVSPDGVIWSQPVSVNQARVISFDSDQLAAGSQFRIFGRNLKFSRNPNIRFVDVQNGQSTVAVVNVSSSSNYLLQATAPASILPGHSYQVFVTNGYNGNSTSGGESLAPEQFVGRTVGMDYWNLGVPWAADLNYSSNNYNIQTDPRLSLHTSGTSNDTAAIQNAVNVASSAGGGIVLLPAGTYNLIYSNGCGINLQPRVAIVGAGVGKTIINYGYGVAPNPGTGYGACFASQSGFSDLSMVNVNQSGLWPESGLGLNANEVFLKRVSWDLGTSQWLALTGLTHLALEDSEFHQAIDSQFGFHGILDIQGCSWCRISGNTIKFAVGGMLFDYTSNVTFENNVVNRDIAIDPDPQSVTHSIEANFATNLFVLSNTIESVGNGHPTNNDGEAINTEGGGPIRVDEFTGSITSSTGLTITDAQQNFYNSSNYYPSLRPGFATVAIVSGQGAGQYRNVTSVSADGQTLTIDRAWDVQPDNGSNYATFDWSAAGWIIANNKLIGNFKGLEFFNASVRDILIESNTLTDGSGVMISPTQQAGRFNVAWNINVIANTIADVAGLRPAYVAVVPREDGQTTSFGTNVIGQEIRNNNVIAAIPNTFVTNPSWDDFKAVAEGYNCYWQWQSSSSGYNSVNSPPPILGAIFQNNLAQNSQTGFYINSGASQTIIANMIARNVSQVITDATISGAAQSSQGTLLTNLLTQVTFNDPNASDEIMLTGLSGVAGGTIQIEIPQALAATGTNSTEIGTTSDSLTLLGSQNHGNLDATVHVNIANSSQTNVGLLMMRDLATPDSAFVSIGESASNVVFQYRPLTGAASETKSTASAGSWIRLTKSGSLFQAFDSPDGLAWTLVGEANVPFVSKSYLAGLSNTSDATSDSQVSFDNFSLESIVVSQPSPPSNTGAGAPRIVARVFKIVGVIWHVLKRWAKIILLS